MEQQLGCAHDQRRERGVVDDQAKRILCSLRSTTNDDAELNDAAKSSSTMAATSVGAKGKAQDSFESETFSTQRYIPTNDSFQPNDTFPTRRDRARSENGRRKQFDFGASTMAATSVAALRERDIYADNENDTFQRTDTFESNRRC